MVVVPFKKSEPWSFEPARSGASLSAQIVSQVRADLFAKRLKPGDFLGTEKEIAARFGVSRIVARDALRTLQALGMAEIRMGRGGGARVAGQPPSLCRGAGHPARPDGVSAGEISMPSAPSRPMAAELAAEHATASRPCRAAAAARRRREQDRRRGRYTRSCRDFHLAVTEASHNRVLVVQLSRWSTSPGPPATGP